MSESAESPRVTRLVIKRKPDQSFTIDHPDGPVTVVVDAPFAVRLVVLAPSTVKIRRTEELYEGRES